MKRSFYIGLLLGVILGGGAFLARQYYTSQFNQAASVHHSKGSLPDPQQWLLPKDFTLSRIYNEPDALAVLDLPEVITIHRAASAGLTILGHTFASEGVSPTSEDAKILHATFHSHNTYTGVSACVFDPGVLVRLKSNEHSVDLLVCFQCNDIAWVLDGREKDAPHAGISELGTGVLRSVFQRVFPEDVAFKPQ